MYTKRAVILRKEVYMAKKEIKKDSQLLVKTRKKYRRSNVIWSIVWFFVVLLLAFIYVFLYAGYNGYGSKGALGFMSKWSFLEHLPYFSTTMPLWAIFTGTPAKEYFKGDMLYRFILLISVFVLAVLVCVLHAVLNGRRLNKKYQRLYATVLQSELEEKDSNLVLHGKNSGEISKSSHVADLLKYSGALDSETSDAMTVSDEKMTWDGVQVEYKYNEKKRNGFLMATTLESSKVDGYLQLRNYGKTLINDYNGINLEKYGFADNNLLSKFVCYSTLDQKIYRTIDLDLAQQIFNLQHFLSSSVVVTLADNDFFVFIDGFKLNLVRPLKEKITADFVKDQAVALNALHQVFKNIGMQLLNDDALLIKVEEESR